MSVPQILAVALVSGGNIVAAKSSPGVTYDATHGVLSFPNNDARAILPIVSNCDIGAPYITSTHWIAGIDTTDIVVMMSALDTGGRTWPGRNFSALMLSLP
jgi:hypothetical protein